MIVSARAERIVSCSDSESDIIDRGNAVCTARRLDDIFSEGQLVIHLGVILRRLSLRIAVAVNYRLIPWGDSKGLTFLGAVRVAFVLCPTDRGSCIGCEQCAVRT